jgi:hypothetical protein
MNTYNKQLIEGVWTGSYLNKDSGICGGLRVEFVVGHGGELTGIWTAYGDKKRKDVEYWGPITSGAFNGIGVEFIAEGAGVKCRSRGTLTQQFGPLLIIADWGDEYGYDFGELRLRKEQEGVIPQVAHEPEELVCML